MIQVITGTDTEVGKTVSTAVLAARALQHGQSVAIYKPAQTGVQGQVPGDALDVARWLGHPEKLTVSEGVRLAEPMAPADAARCAGLDPALALPSLDSHVQRILEMADSHDVVLVEGAGGLLVELTAQGQNIADLAAALGAELVVVARPDLGTLNHSMLTLEACLARGFDHGTLLLGSYPAQPSALHARYLENLRQMAVSCGWHFAGALPANLVADPAGSHSVLHRVASVLDR
ncbi:dethiobiotin synthase [Glutamicibacter sp. JC586]|uniref:dethiobiotin synthase n=1 Tax=Glutamicibacter sp. JC586 TaxID=2590552 RepID=UPI0013586FAD|nr:dethiobiotin synthase [Glutamicibacter sp. JC586]